MNMEQFQASLAQPEPPAALTPLLIALWWDGKGEWDRAHDLAQAEDGSEAGLKNSRDAAWVHAYLHRKEGDRQNAGYWYRTAGHPMPDSSLEEEWRAIASALLQSL